MKQKLLLYILFQSYFSFWGFSQNVLFQESALPIFVIKTNSNQDIVDQYKINGNMQVLYRGVQQRNFLADTTNAEFLNYNGKIGIELRGKYSLLFPQKSYAIETRQDDDSTNNNVAILGLPKENDWILTAQYVDKTFLRDFVAYDIFRRLGHYNPRGQFVEVLVNNEYMGVFLFQEKIKVDKNRVDIDEETGFEANSQDITGGYLFQENDGTDFILAHNEFTEENGIEIVHPKAATDNQLNYLKDFMDEVDFSLLQPNPSNKLNGYPTKIDVNSAIDFILTNETMHNSDSYVRSTFWHKDKYGKLIFGPVWDFNIAAGNDYTEGSYEPNHWEIEYGTTQGPRFLNNLFKDSTFKCYMAQRWQLMRAPNMPFNTDRINAMIDSMAIYLNESQLRHFEKWQNMGVCGEWPAFGCETRNTYQEEVNYLKEFMANKMAWMDANIIVGNENCTIELVPNIVINEIMYKPLGNGENVPNELEFIELKNNNSNNEDLSAAYFRGGGIIYQFPYGTIIPGNGFLVIASNAIAFEKKYGFAPFGQFKKQLSDTEETITLADFMGEEMDQVTYNTLKAWPNTSGKSAELLKSILDNTIAQNWFTNTTLGGSPGVENVEGGTAVVNPCLKIDKITITEINYRSNTLEDTGDWIEIYNPNSKILDISGFKINDGGENPYIVPNGIFLSPKSYLVLAENLVKFNAKHPSVFNIAPTTLTFGLNSTGETISIKNAADCLLNSFTYGTKAPDWPSEANGLGFTLSLKNADLDITIANNWRASINILGTPGLENSFKVIPTSYQITGLVIKQNPSLYISWQVDNPQLINTFEIECSKDSISFFKIGSLAATASENYQFSSTKIELQSGYFRIKTIDNNNVVSYSKIFFLEDFKSNFALLYPNPSQGTFKIQLPYSQRKNVYIQVFDTKGRLITKQYFEDVSFHNLEISLLNEPNGIYYVKIITEKDSKILKLVIGK